MLTIHYFASLKETLNKSEEQLEMPESVANVGELISFLIANEPQQMAALDDSSKVLVAVNQTVVDRNHGLTGTEEVAFFPPMTGG